MKLVITLLAVVLSIQVLASHLIPYRKGNKWGYADSTGKIVVEPIFTSVSHVGDEPCHVVELNGKFGLLNSAGKKATELVYEKMTLMAKDGVTVKKNGKWGTLDIHGKTVLPCTYDELDYYPFTRTIRLVKAGKIEIYSMITRKMRAVPDTDEGAIVEMKLNEEAQEVSRRIDYRHFVVIENNKEKVNLEVKSLGFRNGAMVNKNVSVESLPFEADKMLPLNYYRFPAVLLRKDGKWGVIVVRDMTISNAYDSIKSIVINDNCNAFYFQVMKQGKWGIISAEGKAMTPIVFDEIIYPDVMSKNSMSCLLVADGIQVRMGNKFGLVSITGETLIPLEQNSIVRKDVYYIYSKGDRKGVYCDRFKGELFLTKNDEFSDLVEFHGETYLKIIDSKKKTATELSPKLIGYVNSNGVRFYED